MLLRHTFCFLQLKIEENTRVFHPGSFNESDYLKWRAITYKNTPDLIPEPKTCYGCHKEQCKFVADIYLEFCDRQYAKNTGYKRYREQDFSFEFCYSEFLEVVHYNESDQIVEVIQESKGYICLPPNKEERLVYIRHSVDCFFPFILDRIKFLPDWGLWWRDDECLTKDQYERYILDNFFADSRWSHPDPPERIWHLRKQREVISRLEEEKKTNVVWVESYPKGRPFSLLKDCVWKNWRVPLISRFYVTRLREEGHTCACETQLQHHLKKELD